MAFLYKQIELIANYIGELQELSDDYESSENEADEPESQDDAEMEPEIFNEKEEL